MSHNIRFAKSLAGAVCALALARVAIAADAEGHDAKVWTNDSFRRLMAQGIRWAGGRLPGAQP